MSTRLILHIGSTKTGSSALQSTLHERREELLRVGALYSDHGVAAQAHHLLAAAVHPGAWRMHADIVPGDERARARYFADTVAAMRAEAEASGAHTVIFSSEYFWGCLPPATYKAFAAAFAGMPVEVVAFVRRPEDWSMSSYLQAVKSGESRDFEEWLQGSLLKNNSPLDYFRVINRWAYFLEATRVHVIRYEDVKDNVYRAFCETLGLDVRTEIKMRRVNPSPSPEGVKALLDINRSAASDAEKAEQRRAVMGRHRSSTPTNALMSVAEREEILRAAAPSERLILREFLKREGPLFPPPPSPEPDQPALAGRENIG